MGKDFKIGLVSGLVLAVIALVWVATRPSLSPEARMIQSTKAASDKQTPPQQAVPATEGATAAHTEVADSRTDPNLQSAIRDPQSAALAPQSQPAVPNLTIYEKAEKIKTTRFHIVRKDDTLSTISQQYYGTPTKWRKILDANTKSIKDPHRIQPGTKLIIPE